MTQYQFDPNAIAKSAAVRVRNAAAPSIQLGEQYMTKSASDNNRRERVRATLVAINKEFATYAGYQQTQLINALGAELWTSPEEMGVIMKEASIQALVGLGSYWMQFYGTLGIK